MSRGKEEAAGTLWTPLCPNSILPHNPRRLNFDENLTPKSHGEKGEENRSVAYSKVIDSSSNYCKFPISEFEKKAGKFAVVVLHRLSATDLLPHQAEGALWTPLYPYSIVIGGHKIRITKPKRLNFDEKVNPDFYGEGKEGPSVTKSKVPNSTSKYLKFPISAIEKKAGKYAIVALQRLSPEDLLPQQAEGQLWNESLNPDIQGEKVVENENIAKSKVSATSSSCKFPISNLEREAGKFAVVVLQRLSPDDCKLKRKFAVMKQKCGSKKIKYTTHTTVASACSPPKEQVPNQPERVDGGSE